MEVATPKKIWKMAGGKTRVAKEISLQLDSLNTGKTFRSAHRQEENLIPAKTDSLSFFVFFFCALTNQDFACRVCGELNAPIVLGTNGT